jgi:alkylhydroperoxidase/carboxymuconolactone decarboxylase family protein YurZ
MTVQYPRQDPRSSIALFGQFDAALYATWGEALQRAVEPDELDLRSRAVLRVALDSVVHWSLPIIESHVEDAFNAGSNVAELLEASLHVSSLEGGTHGLHDALEALEMVIQAREQAGRPTPRRGTGLQPVDMIPEAEWPVPPVFPYHAPKPRWHVQVIEKYDPELYAAFVAWNTARFTTRKELTRLLLSTWRSSGLRRSSTTTCTRPLRLAPPPRSSWRPLSWPRRPPRGPARRTWPAGCSKAACTPSTTAS